MRVGVFRFAYWGASQTPGGGGYRWGPLCQARDFGGAMSASLPTHPWRTPFWARTSHACEVLGVSGSGGTYESLHSDAVSTSRRAAAGVFERRGNSSVGDSFKQ